MGRVSFGAMDVLTRFDAEFDAMPGTFSVWCGPVGGPAAYSRMPDALHYPASTIKLGIMVAAYRMAEQGALNLDDELFVHHQFTSAVGGPFDVKSSYDSDPEVWQRLGTTASLWWLLRRMIIRSSNLATNLVLERTGYVAVQEVWRSSGAHHSLTRRGIEDYAAAEAGVENEVTCADLARLLSALQNRQLAGDKATKQMLDVLCGQEFMVDLGEGVPSGTPVALKNGWIDGTRNSAAIVYPSDSPPYVLSVCATTPLATSQDGEQDEACRVLAELSAAAWQARHALTGTASV